MPIMPYIGVVFPFIGWLSFLIIDDFKGNPVLQYPGFIFYSIEITCFFKIKHCYCFMVAMAAAVTAMLRLVHEVPMVVTLSLHQSMRSILPLFSSTKANC